LASQTIINLLNPEIIVIGGGLVNGWKLFENICYRSIGARISLTADRVRIVPAECGTMRVVGRCPTGIDDRRDRIYKVNKRLLGRKYKLLESD